MENPDLSNEGNKSVLRHLLDVESEAASLALEAAKEADKRRSAAKQKADAEYRAKYEQLMRSLDEQFNLEKEKCDAALKAVFSEHDEQLKALRQDTDSFYSFVDSLIASN